MSRVRKAVLEYVRANPGCTDDDVHWNAYGWFRGPNRRESTVKHLLRLRDAGLVLSDGSAHKKRWWFPADVREDAL